jgi:hypothetical protein
MLAGIAAALALISACSPSSDVSRELGAICEERDQCEDRCLVGGRFPDGFCSLSCNSDDECPDGSSCVDREGGVCLFSCEDITDCIVLGEDWRCRMQPERGAGEADEVMVCLGAG